MNTKGKAENLRPFQPGKSGNPGGRPKKIVTDCLAELLGQKAPEDPMHRSYAELLALGMLNRAIAKSHPDAKEILGRVEGKVAENKDDDIERVIVNFPSNWTPRQRPGQQAIDVTPPKTNGPGTLELESKNLLRDDPDGSNNDTDR
jgi:hypothetical protein